MILDSHNKKDPINLLFPIAGSFIFVICALLIYFLNYNFADKKNLSDIYTYTPILSTINIQKESSINLTFSNENNYNLLNEWIPQIPESIEETEWLIIIDISEQEEYIYHNRTFVTSYIVSTGSATGYYYDATLPIGVWRISSKAENISPEIYGPRLISLELWNGTEFVKRNQALHATDEPESLGQPISKGCVYHAEEDILELYEWVPVGTLLITVE